MRKLLSAMGSPFRAVIVAVAVIVAAAVIFARPARATESTSCDNQIGARCMSSTYPNGQYAMKSSGSGSSTCWEVAGQTCDGGYGGDTLSGYSASKP
jgi:hypothetical protein